MITYQRESLFEVVDEVEPLLQLHYQELTLNKDRVQLAPMWTRYAMLETHRQFFVFTARDGDKLVGYSAFFVNPHIHYEFLVVAANDVLFLHPDYRKGLTGVKLIRFSEQELKKLGVHKVTWHIKHSNDFSPILERYGYQDEERVLGKLL